MIRSASASSLGARAQHHPAQGFGQFGAIVVFSRRCTEIAGRAVIDCHGPSPVEGGRLRDRSGGNANVPLDIKCERCTEPLAEGGGR